MRTRWSRAAVGLTLLLGVALAAPAVAAGGPVIDAPDGSTPQYAGYGGPFTVDFTDAEPGTYSCVVTDPSSTVVATCTDEFERLGSGAASHSFHVPGLAAGSYTFRLHQTPFDTPDTTLAFTVRAGAQPTCTATVPRAVRVNSGEEIVTGVLGADCAKAHVTYASWEVDHVTGGLRNLMTFDHRTKDTFSIFSADPLGTYLLRPTQAINAAADDIRQNTPRMDVRLDSRLALRSHRAGKRVTLTATFTKYVRASNRFAVWAKQPVTFSSRTCGTCAWHRLAVRRTGTHGQVVLHVRTAKVRAYRVTAAGAALVWAPYAKVTRR